MRYQNTLMETAKIWAKRSKCKRNQVGAVIAKEGRIISIGYNGNPSNHKPIKKTKVCDLCNGNSKSKDNNIPLGDVYGITKDNLCEKCGGEGIVKTYYDECEEDKIVSKCCKVDTIEDKESQKIYCSNCKKEIGFIDYMKGSDSYRIVGDFEYINKTLPSIIHAEANAILFAAKNGISTNGCELYVTLSPCMECAKMIVQSGIKKVCYNEEYRDISSLSFLKDNNVEIEKLDYNLR